MTAKTSSRFYSETITAIAKTTPPDGTDPALFEKLKTELAKRLSGRFEREGRIVAAAPDGDGSTVTNLQYDDENDRITWSYVNPGDYDLSGDVGIPDITPIALNYLSLTNDGVGDDALESWIDGDKSGDVGIPDITIIANNYLREAAGYKLFGCETETGTFVEFGTVVYPDPPVFPVRFSVVLPQTHARYIRVAPADSSGEPGGMSNTVDTFIPVEEFAPEITSVSPLAGIGGEDVTISAQLTGTLPITYAWDFGTAATPQTSTEETPTVTLNMTAGDYDASLVATNSLGSDTFDFILTVSTYPAPTVNSVTPVIGETGAEIAFDVDYSGLGDITFAWDFGGGATPDTSTDESPTVTLGNTGNYDASVTVANQFESTEYPFTLMVTPVGLNLPPVASLNAFPAEGDSPLEVSFDAGSSYDPDGSLLTFEWDFDGDGWFEEQTDDEPLASHTYEQTGTYYATVKAVDELYLWGFATAKITVGTGSSWTIVNLSEGTWDRSSLGLVDGNPAVVFTRFNDELTYIRSSDSNGLTWGTPVVADNSLGCEFVSMFSDVSRPAVAYTTDDGKLAYIRAADVPGDTWETPKIVDERGGENQYCDLEFIGREIHPLVCFLPAIAYYDSTNGDLCYTSVIDRNGTWGTPIVVDSDGDVGKFCDLLTDAGNPCIFYYDKTNKALKFVRALDDPGDTWGTPITIDSAPATDIGRSLSAVNVGEHPSACYYDMTNSRIKYIRSLDYDGIVWDEPSIVVEDAEVSPGMSIALVGSVPAITYLELAIDSGSLLYIAAADSNGKVWRIPDVVDTDIGLFAYPSMINMSGYPAISYLSSSNPNTISFAKMN